MDGDVAFSLSAADMSEVREQFRGARLGALQLVFIRTAGRSLSRSPPFPRIWLTTCKSLGLNAQLPQISPRQLVGLLLINRYSHSLTRY